MRTALKPHRVVRPYIMRVSHPVMGQWGVAAFLGEENRIEAAQAKFGLCTIERPETECSHGMGVEWYVLTPDEREMFGRLASLVDLWATRGRTFPWWAWIRRREARRGVTVSRDALEQFWRDLEQQR